ncbi:hypothetical protein CVT25_010606 [Psilocybe cyanescens]|uniref:CxC2-like cysteine cluster KDZ transposase-associated domain-containing protein n=1 Tax=Psilocybe cyanescens TaxID=93625 RepID=A0A409XV35_PSICY|nr:hypothetical protein CVT25_010606 [Psilocybe cyanescens]
MLGGNPLPQSRVMGSWLLRVGSTPFWPSDMRLPPISNQSLGIHQNEFNNTWVQPNVPSANGLNNTYVRILHTNGIHYMAMVTCHCRGEHSVPLDLVSCRLLPASFTRIRTLFSVQLMDQFRLFNLELKALAYQFYILIRRMTMPIGRADIVNLYHEFRRMSCLWRWLKKLQWAGYGHKQEDPRNPPAGSLSLYCPTCPQPGINLPDDWKNDPNRSVYKRIFVTDGNFKADHVRQKCNDDVWLIDGAGMAPNCDHYQAFLESAVDRLTKAPCENTFKTIMNALLSTKACDRTGKVAFACARHGCFAPNTLADLFRGEQQKNIDYALLQAIKSTHVEPEQGLLLIYDIVCTWIVYLFDRIGCCFFRYATTFVPGAAIVAGQILESLWSNLNAISSLVRTASLAHREEVLDDHTADSNYKKMLRITQVLCIRYADAIIMVGQANSYFIELSGDIDLSILNEWEDEIQSVKAMRPVDIKRMDIYGARMPHLLTDEPVTDTGTDTDTDCPLNTWLRFTLQVEEKQLELQDKVRRLGTAPLEQDRQVVSQLHQVLTSMFGQIKQLQQAAKVPDIARSFDLVNFQDEAEFDNDDQDGRHGPDASEWPTVDSRTESTSTTIFPERQTLSLPSNFNVPQRFASAELELRKNQARNNIRRIRDIVANISFLYRYVVRTGNCTSIWNDGQKKVKSLNHAKILHTRIYSACRSRLIALKCEHEFLNIFRELTRNDLKPSTAIWKPNVPGSSKIELPWIWMTGRWHLLNNSGAAADTDRLNGPNAQQRFQNEFNRVHWLRARAQKNRWNEEIVLVKYEMLWTVRNFIHRREEWAKVSDMANINSGPKAYAFWQSRMWHKYAVGADLAFKNSCKRYVSPFI